MYYDLNQTKAYSRDKYLFETKKKQNKTKIGKEKF